MYAAMKGHIKIIEYLLSQSTININYKSILNQKKNIYSIPIEHFT